MPDIYERMKDADDETLWDLLLEAEGEERGDVLSWLAMSYIPEREGLPTIAIAELAIEEYQKAGVEEFEVDYAFCWATIAEHKAKIGDFNGALECAVKAQELIRANLLNCYDEFKWEMIKWYVMAGRYDEAHIQLVRAITDVRDKAAWDALKEEEE